jgi:hypothetical protein
MEPSIISSSSSFDLLLDCNHPPVSLGYCFSSRVAPCPVTGAGRTTVLLSLKAKSRFGRVQFFESCVWLATNPDDAESDA